MDERLRPDSDTARSASRSSPFWAQLLITLVVLAAAFVAFVYFYPGSRTLLGNYGIVLPFGPAEVSAPADAARPQGQAQAPGQPQGQGQPGAGQRSGAPGGPGGPGGGGGRTVPLVAIKPATSATINDRLTAIGEGSAASSVTITTSAGGTLLELAVAPGDVVGAGAVIAKLDAQSEQIAIDRAELAASDATAALARANELAASISAVQLSAAQLAADQAALELRNAQLALERRTITTPIAGTVGLMQVNPGNVLSAGTVVTTIEDSSEILVDFWIPERYAPAVAVGMPVAALAVALPGETFDGIVSATDNRVDATSRTLQVQARIPNPDGRIRAGMSFSVTMTFPGDDYVSVDPLAIQWSGDGAYVWRYVDGKVEEASIQIVQRNSSGVLVTGDLAPGDPVVTEGVLQLQPGAQVRVEGEAPPAATPPAATGG
ncbi:MAG: putative Co/Zn/Cd efflux system rane fusion protein [Devosia sp.]|nr:putative Co/Zn/Cd efflux system rane fusion protein [Devosia sp.]